MTSLPKATTVRDELEKRNRELHCLYAIAAETAADGAPEQSFKRIAGHLIDGLLLPDGASASIRVDGVEYSPHPAARESMAEATTFDIAVAGTKRGTIEIGLEDPAILGGDGRRLAGEVALRIGHMIERHELAGELKRYAGKLEELANEKTQELERSKRRYEDFFKDAPTPMLISNMNGDVMKANRQFYRLLDYPEDGSVHLNFVRDGLYEDPAIRPVIFEKLQRHGFLEGFELSLLDRKGTPIPVLASYIIIDVDGVPCVESVYKDIRLRKDLERKLIEQNENLEQSIRLRTIALENQKDLLIKKNKELLTLTDKLRESKIRLQTLFKAITDTVVVIDPDLNILMSNQKGIGSKGKCYKKVFNQEGPCEDCPIDKVFEEKKRLSLEQSVDGEHYLLHVYPVFDSQCQVTGVLEFSRVITKEKNMEQQLLQADKLASLGQLVSGIAHEINNPNTFIKGNLSIIQEALNDIMPILDRAYEARPDLRIARLNYDMFRQSIPVLVDDMVQGANRIKGIVDGLRKFAKRDEGLLNESVDVNSITEACLRLVDNQVRRTADVQVHFDPELPAITGNSQKLQQVIVNVLINASQAIDKQRGTIDVSSSRPNDREIILKVTDNGKGIEEKMLKQIFDPFYTTKRNQGGTGLGLSIAYGIIKEHKGRIEVQSKVGVGTTFSIYLPTRPEEA